jgi:DNA-binding PadR family transcriptional regulator
MISRHCCPCVGNTLDRLVQPAILSELLRGPLHGYRIAQRIARRLPWGDTEPDASGVYRFLKQMERNGLVRSTWDIGEKGPARRKYAITYDGAECLAVWIDTLQRYRKGIGVLLRTARAAMKDAVGKQGR